MGNIDILRKAVGKQKRVESGTVVRYTKQFEGSSRDYNYVAVYIAATDKWYTTGRYDSEYTYADFVAELAKASNVEVASAWSAL